LERPRLQLTAIGRLRAAVAGVTDEATDEATDCGVTLGTLTDHNDWGNLTLGAMNDADFGGSGPPVITCSF
jgi:hypothetical protein